jgi:hypothetical protein
LISRASVLTLSAAGSAALLGLQVLSWQAVAHARRDGAPSLRELMALECARQRVVSADLSAARIVARDPRVRRVPLPPHWPDRARDLPFLMVFVDDARLVFHRSGPVGPEPQAFYERVPGGRVMLGVRCAREGPCQTLAAVPDDAVVENCVGWARVRGGAAGAATAGVLAAFAATLFLRRAWTSAFAWLQLPVVAALTVFFVAGRLGRTAYAAPLLALQVIGLGLPWLRRTAPGAMATARSAAIGAEQLIARALDGRAWTRWAVPAAAVLIGLVLLAPMGFGTCIGDWATHLYYMQRQAESLRQLGHPSYFLHTDGFGAFYPYFAFYGGTLYVLTAAVALLVGSVGAYISTWVAGMAACFLGCTQVARMTGLRGTAAYLPGLAAITSGYYLTNVYGRGSWGEFMATSSVPLVVASAGAVLMGRRGVSPCWTLLAAMVVLSGSHSLSFVWATTFVALVALVTLPALAAEPGWRWSRLGTVGAWAAAGVGLNGWFLGPLLAWARFTHIGAYSAWGMGSNRQDLIEPGVVFALGRADQTTAGFQLSVLVLAWALAAGGAVLRRGTRMPVRVVWLAFVVLLGFLVALLVTSGIGPLWRALPRLHRSVQFEFRVHTYAAYTIIGLMLLGLSSVRSCSTPRLWLAGAVAAVAVQCGQAGVQVLAHPWCGGSFPAVLTSGTKLPDGVWHHLDYRFMESKDHLPLGEPVPAAPEVSIEVDVGALSGDRALVVVPADKPGRVGTNISWSPLIEAVGDLTIAGRTTDGLAVLERRPGHVGEARAVIGPSRPRPVVLGRLLSCVSLAAVALLAWQERRRKPPRV